MKALNNVKKTVALTLAVIMASSVLASCGKDSAADEAILELSEDIAKYLCDCKISKLAKVSTSDFESEKDDWAEDLDFSLTGPYMSEEARVYEAIAQTIEYSIDEDSVSSSVKNQEGRVCVEFTVADYEELLDDPEAMTAPEDFISKLDSCDEEEIELWFDFELEDGEWHISNTDEILENLFDFRNQRFVFVPDLSRSSFDAMWFGTDWDYVGNVYTNPFYIELMLFFYDDSDISQIYFTVEYNGDLVYTGSCYEADASYYVTDTGAPVDLENNCFAEGEYRITFYDGNDNEIYSDTCTVMHVDITPSDYINWYFEDMDWGLYALYDSAEEIDPDLDLGSLNGYSSFDYYYVVTYNGEIVYTSPEGEYMGYYYAAQQTSASYLLMPGVYEVSFYDVNGTTGTPIVTATAIVLQNGVGPDGTFLGAFLGLNVTGRNMGGDMINDFSSAYWYSADPAAPEEDMIFDGADSLTYRIPVTQDYGELSYIISYSDNGNAGEVYDSSVINSNDVATVQVDEDGNMFYEIHYDGTVSDGYYRVTVLAENGIDFTVFSVCKVQ